MKFSADSIMKSLTPFRGYLYTVHFDDDDFNCLNSGGDIDTQFPAISVQEDLFNINYDQVSVVNGMSVQIPQYINYLGNLNLNFWDKMSEDQALLIEKAFIEWTGEVFNDNGGIKQITKGMYKSVEITLKAAQKGDVIAKNIFQEAGKNLGVGLVNLITLFDPELILVGGEGIRAGELILQPMREVVINNFSQRKEIKIIPLQAGEEGWLIGAAELVLSEVFKTPILLLDSFILIYVTYFFIKSGNNIYNTIYAKNASDFMV